MSGFDTLITGVTIHVKFTNSNTAASPTLTVGSAAAKAIKMYGTTAVGTSVPLSWPAGAVVSFTYDGTNWIMNDFSAYNLDASRLTTGTVPAARLPSDYKKIYYTTSFTETSTGTGGDTTIYYYAPNTTDIPDLNYRFAIFFAGYAVHYIYSTGSNYSEKTFVLVQYDGASSKPVYVNHANSNTGYIKNTTALLIYNGMINKFNRDYTDYEITKNDIKPQLGIYFSA